MKKIPFPSIFLYIESLEEFRLLSSSLYGVSSQYDWLGFEKNSMIIIECNDKFYEAQIKDKFVVFVDKAELRLGEKVDSSQAKAFMFNFGISKGSLEFFSGKLYCLAFKLGEQVERADG